MGKKQHVFRMFSFLVGSFSIFHTCHNTLNSCEPAVENQFSTLEKLVIETIWLIDRQSFPFATENVEQLRLWVGISFMWLCALSLIDWCIFMTKRSRQHRPMFLCTCVCVWQKPFQPDGGAFSYPTLNGIKLEEEI